MTFQKEIGDIYRLKVPFENLYTSVFIIKKPVGNVLVDCATYDSDVDEYILPALKSASLSISDVDYLVLTHAQGDHAGGLKRILHYNSNIKVVKSGDEFSIDAIRLYALKGHTLDCVGVFDESTGTLISGDGLQGAGIGKYRCSITSKEEYLKTIEKIDKDDKIENILFSHAYEPWYKDYVKGREQIKQCLKDCKNYI